MKKQCKHGYFPGGCTNCNLKEVIKRAEKQNVDPEILKFLGYYQVHLDASHRSLVVLNKIARKHGYEEVKRLAIEALRSLANTLENNPHLHVSYLELPTDDPPASKSIIDGIKVAVSLPWGG